VSNPKSIEVAHQGPAPKGKLFELAGRCPKELENHPAFIISGVMGEGRFEFLDTYIAVGSSMGSDSKQGNLSITESTLIYCHFCKESMGVLCNACERYYCNGSLSKRYGIFTMFTCPCGNYGKVSGLTKLIAHAPNSKGKSK